MLLRARIKLLIIHMFFLKSEHGSGALRARDAGRFVASLGGGSAQPGEQTLEPAGRDMEACRTRRDRFLQEPSGARRIIMAAGRPFPPPRARPVISGVVDFKSATPLSFQSKLATGKRLSARNFRAVDLFSDRSQSTPA